MAYSYIQYPAVGTNYTVPFPFLDRSHVRVAINGIYVPFSWLSLNLVQLAAPPASGTVVEVRRNTPATTSVDFVDGSVLTEKDLDLSALQLLYLAQEALDLATASVRLAGDGTYSAHGHEITDVADPTRPTSAATRQFAERVAYEAADAMGGQVYFLLVEPDGSTLTPSTYIHTQTQEASEWTVSHNLNTYPNVTVYDSEGNFLLTEWSYIDKNQLKINFARAYAGKAYIH